MIERNEILVCSMVLEEYVTDKGQPLMFRDERSRFLGEIKIGFDRAFGASSEWEVGYYWVPQTFFRVQTVVIDSGFRQTETDGGGNIYKSRRASLGAGRALEQVRFRETTANEKFYAYIKYDFGMFLEQQNFSEKKLHHIKNYIRCMHNQFLIAKKY